jgi:hypothetical protein
LTYASKKWAYRLSNSLERELLTLSDTLLDKLLANVGGVSAGIAITTSGWLASLTSEPRGDEESSARERATLPISDLRA